MFMGFIHWNFRIIIQHSVETKRENKLEKDLQAGYLPQVVSILMPSAFSHSLVFCNVPQREQRVIVCL